MQNSIWNRNNEIEEIKEELSEQKEISEGRFSFDETEENFGGLHRFVIDENITDIDWNGKSLWLTTTMNERICVKDAGVDKEFYERFAQRVSNINGEVFNRMNPILEAETNTLRLSFIHPVQAVSGLSCCIRKTPPIARIDALYAITSRLCDEKLLHLFINCIKAHLNIVICGEPRAGKTEFGKYLTTYIPDYERVITIEDVAEWRYGELKPDADCVQIRVDERFTYSDAIKAALKQNPRWICLTETRGNEIRDLIKSFSTGVSGITTLHTSDVKNVPERMVNMLDDEIDTTHFINNVYEYIDIAILVTVNIDKDGKPYRKISQVGVFGKEDGTQKNFCRVIYSEGHFVFDNLPTYTRKKLQDAGVDNPYFNEVLFEELKQRGYQSSVSNMLHSYRSEKSDIDMSDIKKELEELEYGGSFMCDEEDE